MSPAFEVSFTSCLTPPQLMLPRQSPAGWPIVASVPCAWEPLDLEAAHPSETGQVVWQLPRLLGPSRTRPITYRPLKTSSSQNTHSHSATPTHFVFYVRSVESLRCCSTPNEMSENSVLVFRLIGRLRQVHISQRHISWCKAVSMETVNISLRHEWEKVSWVSAAGPPPGGQHVRNVFIFNREGLDKHAAHMSSSWTLGVWSIVLLSVLHSAFCLSRCYRFIITALPTHTCRRQRLMPYCRTLLNPDRISCSA